LRPLWKWRKRYLARSRGQKNIQAQALLWQERHRVVICEIPWGAFHFIGIGGDFFNHLRGEIYLRTGKARKKGYGVVTYSEPNKSLL
jgi:hypothetical protein